MADSNVTIERIIEIKTGESYQSLGELKKAVDANAKSLKELDKDSEEYDKTLIQLKTQQQAYSTAVRLSVQENNKAAGSYNALSAEMSRLKEAWKATGDEAERRNLAGRIKAINKELKQMDEDAGFFQRNVGDYANALQSVLGEVPGTLGNIQKGLAGADNALKLMSKNPIMGTMTLLTPLVTELAKSLKESGNATAALKKAGEALKPVLGFLQSTFDKLVDYTSVLIEKVLEFTQGGLFKKIIDGVVGVGNAIMNFVVAPFKGIVAAIKVFKEQGVKGLGDAGKAFLAEMKQGVAFKSNYKAGQEMADTLAAGFRSKKKDVVNAAREVAEEVRTELMKVTTDGEDAWLKEYQEQVRQQAELDKEVLADIAAQEKEIADNMKAYYDEQAAAAKAAQDALKARRDMVVASGEAIESILGSVAQAYNTEIQAELNAGKIGEKEARKRFAFVKAFQLAQAILNTASGVMSVFSAPDNITMTQKWLQAAAVTARGAASIASIKSSNINTGAAASQATQVTSLMNAGQTAPAVQTLVPITRVGTNAEDEERLNELQRSQRVYVVYSDIAEVGNRVDVVQAESGF